MPYANIMLRLPLDGNHDVFLDEADQLLISGFPWRVLKHKSGLYYAHAWHGQLHLYMHRLIAGAGPRETVDHWNGHGLDNQRHNLRIASRHQQQGNRGKQLSRSNRMSSSQYKGVSWDRSRNRWIAGIHHDGKTRSLGRFEDEEMAAHAYDVAATELWGSFARLNFPVFNGAVCGRHKLGIESAPCVC